MASRQQEGFYPFLLLGFSFQRKASFPLYLSCGKLYKVHYVVGLNFCFVSRLIAVYFAAFGAFVEYYIALFRVGNNLYGVHNAVAFASSVAGVHVYVERAEALRAVVARGIAQGLYLKSAVGTDKAVIVFCEKFLFHYAFLYSKSHRGWLFVFYSFVSLRARPSSSSALPSKGAGQPDIISEAF